MFVYKNWDIFCSMLSKSTTCLTAIDALSYDEKSKYIVIKHDVETNVSKALEIAKIEAKYDIQATYYVQLYLLNDDNNISLLKEIQKLGHEVTYHYDVLDANNGDWNKAQKEFDSAIEKFNKHGFTVKTVCPHGNPVMDRKGWSSNKDFFRNCEIHDEYSNITDIVIDVDKFGRSGISYISDAGFGWKLISDISNNDKEGTTPDIALKDLDAVLKLVNEGKSLIISAHPHRWFSSEIAVKFRLVIFRILRSMANVISKIPIFNKILSKFYFLAKKI